MATLPNTVTLDIVSRGISSIAVYHLTQSPVTNTDSMDYVSRGIPLQGIYHVDPYRFTNRTQPLYITGKLTSGKTINLYIQGKNTTSVLRGLYQTGYLTTSKAQALYINGIRQSNSSRSIYINGNVPGSPSNRTIGVRITGYVSPSDYQLNPVGITLVDQLGGISQMVDPIAIPTWTTIGRPAGSRGQIGYNTQTGYLELYNGSAWMRVGMSAA